MRRRVRSILVVLAAGLSACGGGGGGGGGGGAPTAVQYAANPASYRAGSAIVANVATVSGGAATQFVVAPPLPAGLALDASTGVISGTPQASAATAPYLVTASNGLGSAQTSVSIQVTPALPAQVVSLASGFEVEAWKTGLSIPVRLALAPDGRVFFNELQTGAVRVIDAAGALLPTPVTTISVLVGPHSGLLGLAIDPQFASNGFLYVFASVPAAGPKPDRQQILRLTLAGNVATTTTVLVDDLPIGSLNNGGELAIGPDGRLYATLGDTADAALAQTDGVLPGRVLRYTTTGAIPGDNPIASSPEWCRGIRNTFGLCFHPTSFEAIGVDNGPATDDKLNRIVKGKDFGWPSAVFGGTAGVKLYGWATVIAPTCVTYYTGGAFGAGFDDNLFIGSYADFNIHRLAMSGTTFIDVDSEDVFMTWVSGNFNRPLDIEQASDGRLYVATFDAIYRIKRSP